MLLQGWKGQARLPVIDSTDEDDRGKLKFFISSQLTVTNNKTCIK